MLRKADSCIHTVTPTTAHKIKLRLHVEPKNDSIIPYSPLGSGYLYSTKLFCYY